MSKIKKLRLADDGQGKQETRRLIDRIDLPEFEEKTKGENWYIEDSTGFLFIRFRASNTGVLTYPEYGGLKVYTSEEVQARCLKRLSTRPVTLEHPRHPDTSKGAWVDTENIKTEIRGSIMGESLEMVDGGIEGWLMVTDKQLIQPILKKEIVQLSLGHENKLRFEPGEADGKPFDAETLDIIYNHLSFVPVGRAGQAGAIPQVFADHLNKGGNQVLKKIMLKAFSSLAITSADKRVKLADAVNLGDQEFSIQLSDESKDSEGELDKIETRYNTVVGVANAANQRVAEMEIEISSLKEQNKRLTDEAKEMVPKKEIEKRIKETEELRKAGVILKLEFADTATHDEKRLQFIQKVNPETAKMVEAVRANSDEKLYLTLLDTAYHSGMESIKQKFTDMESDDAINTLPNSENFVQQSGGDLYDIDPRYI